jgi:hypothetical protein
MIFIVRALICTQYAIADHNERQCSKVLQ